METNFVKECYNCNKRYDGTCEDKPVNGCCENYEPERISCTRCQLFFYNPNIKLPEKSGDYLCITKYNFLQHLHYSAKHKLFNIHDETKDTANAIHVVGWAEFPSAIMQSFTDCDEREEHKYDAEYNFDD